MRKTNKILFMTGVLALVSCSGVKSPETYTDKSGNTTVIETDHEMCVHACNETYSRCMDTSSAQDNSGVNGPRGMFGAGADCRNDLKNCLPGCQSR